MDAERLIQAARAAQASMDADREREAFFYNKTSHQCVELALSKAHVEIKKTLDLWALRLLEIEDASLELKGRETA